MSKLRVTGDVHGHIRKYVENIKAAAADGVTHSIQIGDMGFDYAPLMDLDPAFHKFVGGNHDNYDNLPPHCLKEFGTYKVDELTIFYIRGAYSVDKHYRVPGISWWAAEELSLIAMNDALAAYKEAKPDVVITHDCPKYLLPRVITNHWKLQPSNTNELLNECWLAHEPKRWYFGHHHQDLIIKSGNTRFRCLAEASHIDLNTGGQDDEECICGGRMNDWHSHGEYLTWADRRGRGHMEEIYSGTMDRVKKMCPVIDGGNFS